MMKNKWLFLCLSLLLIGCNNVENMFDNLGGGGVADDVVETPVDGDDALVNSGIENPGDDKMNTDAAEGTNIDLNNLVTSPYYTYSDNILSIQEGGTYVLKGTLNGALEISGEPDEITIILDNVNIATLDSQNCAAIVFKSHKGTRKLTIKDNSINYLSDSVGDTKSDGDNAVIQAKKSSLIINGKGTLNLEAKGEETTGIKIKKDLEIYGATINIEVSDHGIKSGEIMSIYEANINITCLGDGIKTDVEATSVEEGNELTSNPFAGYLYIYNSNIKIDSKDDGVSANSYLKINNTADYTIDIITNGGAPSNITESSSDKADGKAIKVDGITLVDENDNETYLLSKCEDNYYLVILGGTFKINSNDDAISSKGNLLIDSGTFDITTGDDGIHAEYITTINNGNIKINNSYEGIEGAIVQIYGGNIDLKSKDDGINAANADLTNYSYNIYIGGGNIEIDASGDGVDSNGTIEFNGGTTIIYGPSNGANGSLDADRGIKVNGGTLLAIGAAGMVETPGTNSTQYCISYNMSKSITGSLTVADSEGNELISVTSAKLYQSLVVSLPEFAQGKTYKIITSNETKEITITSIITKVGESFGGPGGGSGWPGGRP